MSAPLRSKFIVRNKAGSETVKELVQVQEPATPGGRATEIPLAEASGDAIKTLHTIGHTVAIVRNQDLPRNINVDLPSTATW